jgi:acyl carrier protein
MIGNVLQLLDEHGQLQAPARVLKSDADLYAAGLTPFAAIRLMIALERNFEITFKQRMLHRQSFSSIDSIVACLNELKPPDQRQLKAA